MIINKFYKLFKPIHPIFHNENIEITMLEYFAVYPMISIRKVALQTGIAKSSIHSTFMKHKFYAYSISLAQYMTDHDVPTRVHCCEFI